MIPVIWNSARPCYRNHIDVTNNCEFVRANSQNTTLWTYCIVILIYEVYSSETGIVLQLRFWNWIIFLPYRIIYGFIFLTTGTSGGIDYFGIINLVVVVAHNKLCASYGYKSPLVDPESQIDGFAGYWNLPNDLKEIFIICQWTK